MTNDFAVSQAKSSWTKKSFAIFLGIFLTGSLCVGVLANLSSDGDFFQGEIGTTDIIDPHEVGFSPNVPTMKYVQVVVLSILASGRDNMSYYTLFGLPFDSKGLSKTFFIFHCLCYCFAGIFLMNGVIEAYTFECGVSSFDKHVYKTKIVNLNSIMTSICFILGYGSVFFVWRRRASQLGSLQSDAPGMTRYVYIFISAQFATLLQAVGVISASVYGLWNFFAVIFMLYATFWKD